MLRVSYCTNFAQIRVTSMPRPPVGAYTSKRGYIRSTTASTLVVLICMLTFSSGTAGNTKYAVNAAVDPAVVVCAVELVELVVVKVDMVEVDVVD